MRSWRALALVAVVAAIGAVGTLAVGVAIGMDGRELLDLAAYLAPALAVTVVAIAVAGPLLSRASMRQRFGTVALVGTVVGLTNLFVLAQTMFVNGHDASLVGVLLLYSIGAGVGSALAVARTSASAIDRLAQAARALGHGDLETRVGELNAGPELDTLARTLDEMAERLREAQERERRVEAIRRDLITAVSHDLRTPLASLRAMVEAIDEGVVDDAPSLRRYAAEMRRSVNQLVGMVDDLFELAQIDAGAIEAETRWAPLEEVVRSAVAAVELQAEASAGVIEAFVEPAGFPKNLASDGQASAVDRPRVAVPAGVTEGAPVASAESLEDRRDLLLRSEDNRPLLRAPVAATAT
jgi:signal transduction histidine kinase